MGHSIGATLLLHDAILHPKRWKTLIIIEPALFTPPLLMAFKLAKALKFYDYFHPLITATKHRKIQ